MVGIDTRATMDMDVTIKGLPVNEETVRDLLTNIPNMIAKITKYMLKARRIQMKKEKGVKHQNGIL